MNYDDENDEPKVQHVITESYTEYIARIEREKQQAQAKSHQNDIRNLIIVIVFAIVILAGLMR